MSQADEWISAEFQRLAEVLYDYDPNLALEMVPVAEWDNLVDKTKIFRVIDTKRNKIVLYANGVANPQEILARVWSMDQEYNNVIVNLDAQNLAAKALQIKRHDDEIAEQREFALFIIKNKKSTWYHDGRVRDEHFRDKGPIRKIIT
jgi:hypothetical protein